MAADNVEIEKLRGEEKDKLKVCITLCYCRNDLIYVV